MVLTPEIFNKTVASYHSGSNLQYLLAVSGGADSMVLLELFKDSGLQFQVAHVNYKLRGADSELDQKLVEEYCNSHGIKLHIYEVSEEDKPAGSIQIWARELRYAFFFKILKEQNLDCIATAHHLNDALETFLINLSRGTGIRGLAGIPENENRIIRPLLNFTKKDIYAFAERYGVAFREDLSNQKNDYLRNQFRNEIIPKLEDVSSGFLDGFKESLLHLKGAEGFIQEEIDASYSSLLIKENSTEIILSKSKLLALKPFLRQEIILKFGFRGEEIHKILSAENGKMFRSRTHEIYILRDEIRCVMKATANS